jgi:molybdenum cofactor biosynthesis enzyme MoaA
MRFLMGVNKAMTHEIANEIRKYMATLSDIPKDLQRAKKWMTKSSAANIGILYHYYKNNATSCKSLKGLTYGYSY